MHAASQEAMTRDPRAKYVPPAIDQRAFNCPHCGTLTTQFWYSAHAVPLENDQTPQVCTLEKLQEIDGIEEDELRERVQRLRKRMVQGRPFLEGEKNDPYGHFTYNQSISECFSCRELALWVYDWMVWPQRGEAPLPNPDLPDEIRRDYDEAGTILDQSPRGAAALLRLAVQKLCKELGESGENINEDIAALVRKGLDVRVKGALDVVRVVGNNALHPGQIDLRDDRATAEKLFGLVNLIAEIMISQPKHVQEMLQSLPEGVREAIERRDEK